MEYQGQILFEVKFCGATSVVCAEGKAAMPAHELFIVSSSHRGWKHYIILVPLILLNQFVNHSILDIGTGVIKFQVTVLLVVTEGTNEQI